MDSARSDGSEASHSLPVPIILRSHPPVFLLHLLYLLDPLSILHPSSPFLLLFPSASSHLSSLSLPPLSFPSSP